MPSWRERVALAALCLAAAATTLAAGGRILVPADVVVERDPVRLRDVASLDGAEAEALADVVLGPAPQAGESRTLDGARVLAALRRGGLPADVTYTIPALVRIRRAMQELRADAVRPLVEEFLRRQLGDGPDAFDLRTVELPGVIPIPTGAWSAHVSVPPGVALAGRVRLALEIVQDDRPVRTVWVTAEVGRVADVVVPTRAIARGETLGAADVTLQRVDLGGVPKGMVTDPAEAAGAIARVPLLPFAPLRHDQIGTPVIVRRGETVLLVAERRGLRITVSGEARHDAGRGEQVVVVNRSSGKQLTGRVTDVGTVAVEF